MEIDKTEAILHKIFPPPSRVSSVDLGVGSHILNIVLSRFLSAIRETILPFSATLYRRCRLGR